MLCILTAKSCDVSQVIWFQLTKHQKMNLRLTFVISLMCLLAYGANLCKCLPAAHFQCLLLIFRIYTNPNSEFCSFSKAVQQGNFSKEISTRQFQQDDFSKAVFRNARQFSERQGIFQKGKTVSSRQFQLGNFSRAVSARQFQQRNFSRAVSARQFQQGNFSKEISAGQFQQDSFSKAISARQGSFSKAISARQIQQGKAVSARLFHQGSLIARQSSRKVWNQDQPISLIVKGTIYYWPHYL